ncbi:Acyl-CoA dehydrogenase/oxidase domain protein [Arcticibacter svalbardensis MN12-7]|uniref:Acyl-CoA dehydrogenase/oxidase domain protein n=1 Tax=Arcticibacter svalbardensis MN12-7 TaxID=1150600 RepID=R9GPN2_9SPHI|nr:acyl-CoA dehydrogenase family protein [Arcticibacter svalbardensis]EOR93656.1 Acyl-CoA dehydrogenase/oxidase domain protein [Arcticibacter svalbardensis MN12-7]
MIIPPIVNQVVSLQDLCDKIAQNAVHIDQEGCFPEHEFKWMSDASLMDITLPGKPLSFEQDHTAELLDLLKQIGRANLPVGRIYEGHINALYLIHLFGTLEQQERWFSDVTTYEKLFGVWNTQDAGGVRIHDLGDGQYRLEGSKTFCSGAGWVECPLITGELLSADGKGWQMCILPKEKVQLLQVDSSFWKPLGMRASASFKVDFTGIEIEEIDLLGPPDAYYRQPYFSGGAIRFAAVQLGAAEAILEETQQFLRNAHRTEDAFQRARVAEISFLVETGNLWIHQAGIKYDLWVKQADKCEQLLAYANMTRTVIEDVCLRVMQLAERSIGSRGLMRPNNLERIHRDLTTYLRQPAPDQTLTAIGEYVLNQDTTRGLWNEQ